MQDPLLLSLLVPRLDNHILCNLSQTVIWNELSAMLGSNYYWYERTRNLLVKDIAYREGDWKSAYYILQHAIHLSNPFKKQTMNSLIAVQVLLDLGFDPSMNNSRALLRACSSGNVQVVRLLLEDGRANPGSTASSSLVYSSSKGYVELVRLLLGDKRTDPRAQDSIALLYASTFGHAEVVKLLLEDGRVDSQANNNLALTRASEKGHTEVVHLLQEHI